MDLNTLISALSTAMAADAATKAWSNTNYGQDHTVFENMDARDVPEDDDCPMAMIRPANRSGGLSQPQKQHVIYVDSVVYDTAMVTTSGVRVFTGGRNVEAFRKLIFTAIKAAIPSGCWISTVSVDYDTIEQFPYHWCGMTVEIAQEQTIGSDPFE